MKVLQKVGDSKRGGLDLLTVFNLGFLQGLYNIIGGIY
jgi:hypothetical protein